MAKCPRCGADNPDYSFYCGKCSADLRDSSGRIIVASTQEVPAEETKVVKEQTAEIKPVPVVVRPPKLVNCAYCGRQVNANTLHCPFCGKNPRGPWEGGSYESDYSTDQPVEGGGRGSGTLVLGGIMAILAGALALGQGLLYMTASSLVSYVPGSGSLCFCGGLDAAFGLGSLIGGILAIRRTNFGLALAGAIVGMLGFGIVIGSLFGLIALICIAISRQEFED